MRTDLASIIRTARTAEIQAISIYEAELFFIRNEKRRALLKEILAEEREHDDAMKGEVGLGALSLLLNRLAGWMFGSFLACLPWGWMCRIQHWAEGQAAEVYERAATQAKTLGASAELIHSFESAARQERLHAARFRLRKI